VAKFTVVAAVSSVLGRTEFDSYELASDYAAFMLVGQPLGYVELLDEKGLVVWSYQRSRP